ncbi:hypothetical protein LBMAG38_15840 [Chloroflexota bacterium]|nr:hypothetical protein LBMAG38_15840 [Chloroflexota bacterium]
MASTNITPIRPMPDDIDPPTDEAITAAAHAIAEALVRRGESLAVAEGSTGGYLAHVLTQQPGASAWFRAGIVSYTDYAKQLLLRVASETIEDHGSISVEATVQMARLTRRMFNTDWSIAITGFADNRQPAKSTEPVPGAPQTNPVGVLRVDGEIADAIAGATIISIIGQGEHALAADGEGVQWQEHLVPSPDRSAYKRGATLVALELLRDRIEQSD